MCPPISFLVAIIVSVATRFAHSQRPFIEDRINTNTTTFILYDQPPSFAAFVWASQWISETISCALLYASEQTGTHLGRAVDEHRSQTQKNDSFALIFR